MQRAVLLAGTLLVLALTAAASLAVPVVATNDGPQHLVSAFLELHLDALSPLLQARLEHHAPPTANAYRLVFLPLEPLLGWRHAHNAVFLFWSLVWATGAAAFAHRVAGRPTVGMPLAACTALNWLFYYGFINFYASLALGWWILALFDGAAGWTRRRLLACTALLLAACALHVVGAAIVGLLLTAVIARATGVPLAQRATALATLAAPSIVLVAVVSALPAALMTVAPEPSLLSTTSQPVDLLRIAAAGPAWRAGGLCLFALAGAGRALARGRRSDRALAAAAVVAAAFFLFFPVTIGDWQKISPRFGAVAVVLGVALLGATLRHRAALALTLPAVAFAAWPLSFQLGVASACGSFWSLLEAPLPARDATRLVVPFRGCQGTGRTVPGVHLLFHGGAYLAAAHGGEDLGFANSPAIHAWSWQPGTSLPRNTMLMEAVSVLARSEPPAEAAARANYDRFVAAASDAIGSVASQASDVTLVGAPPAVPERLRARGFASDWQGGDVEVLRFVGCPGTLTLGEGWAVGEQVAVRTGWIPLDEPAASVGVRVPSDRVVPLPSLPCGPAWVSVRAADGAACQAPGGRLAFTAPAPQPPVCERAAASPAP